jgi:CheY-like chemotaxis protein
MLTIVDDKNRGFALGACDYMVKPFDKERLLSVLHQHLSAPRPRVLVAEDDVAARQLLKRILEREAWDVVEARNGLEALSRLREMAPEVILLDLMMPEMDGFTFVEEMRKHEEWRAIPVVVVTAKQLNAEDLARLQGSVENILQKGVYTREELLQEVRALVDARAHERGIP